MVAISDKVAMQTSGIDASERQRHDETTPIIRYAGTNIGEVSKRCNYRWQRWISPRSAVTVFAEADYYQHRKIRRRLIPAKTSNATALKPAMLGSGTAAT